MAPCTCTACRLRRLRGPLALITVGALLLAYMLRPAWTPALLFGVFLLLAGGWRLATRLAPGAAAHGRRPGDFPTLLLLLVGAIIVAHHLDPALPWGGMVARFWPVLLILWGLARLLDRGPGARRGLSAPDLLLLAGIVLVGLAFSSAYGLGRAPAWGIRIDAWNPFLQHVHFRSRATAPLAPGEPVVVRGFSGSLRVLAGPAGNAMALETDTVYAANPAQARRNFQAARPRLVARNGRLLVLAAGEGGGPHLRSDLVLTLPPDTPLEADMGVGAVAVEGWQAPLRIAAGSGAVTLGHIQGDVRIATRGASVSCDHITGSVSLTGFGSAVAMADVSGPVTLDGNFAGALSFRRLAQGLRLTTPRRRLRLQALPGRLDDTSSRIAIAGVAGLTLDTTDTAVDVRQARGPVQLRTSNGAVRLSLAAPPAAPVSIADANANVVLLLPAASAFQLQARAVNGHIQASDFSIPVRVQGRDATAAGGPAAAPLVQISTSNGSITVSRGGPGD